MANLLDLVDQLIGPVLAGNIYTNIDTYVNSLRTPLQSPTGLAHPHTDSNVIPSGKMHGPPLMTRPEIYQQGVDRPSVPEQVITSTGFDPVVTREQIYTSDSLNRVGPPPPDITTQSNVLKENPSLAKGKSFDPARRDNIYKKDFTDPERITVPGAVPSNAKQVISNIGGTSRSQPSVGDLKAAQGKPPTSPLSDIRPGSARKDFAPTEGRIELDQDDAHRLGNLYDDKGVNFFSRGGTYSVPSYGLLRTLDIAVMAHWLRNVSRQVYFIPSDNNDPITRDKARGTPAETIVKSVTWLASQFLLASLNKGDVNAHGISNMVWNPLSFPVAMLPGTRGLSILGITPTGITGHATGLFGTYKSNVQDAALAGADRLQLIRQGAYSEVAPVHRLSQLRSPVATPGFFGDLAKAGESDTLQQEKIPGVEGVSVQGQVDGGLLTLLAAKLGYHTNLYNPERPYAGTRQGQDNALYTQENARLDSLDGLDPGTEKLKILFDPKGFPGGTTTAFDPLAYNFVSRPHDFVVGFDGFELADAPGINAATTDAALPGEDPNTALVATNPINENEIYMPFMFQDLRDSAAGQPEQFLYFRAFLKDDLTETFTPDWQTERYYGRVDEIPTYLGTGRNINVSFDVVAWSPKDLPVIYTKLQKLQSMVYPTYTAGGFMSAGPIIKMRIGDLIAGLNNRGLPGYITSLDFAYDDGIWNIQQDFKVPRKISISISFTVLHDGNPGIYPYASADIAPDGSSTAVGGPTFGAGKFVRNSDGVFTATVSVRDIRKIFGSVRNIAT